MRATPRITTASLVAALLVAAPAAAAAPPDRIETFTGSCQSQARVNMDPPMSGEVRETRVDIASEWAKCTGTVETGGHVYSFVDAPTVGELHGNGPSSCEVSATQGWGQFTIANRWRIDFTYVEPRLGPVGLLPYSGIAGGSAIDVARLSSEEDSVDIVERCGGEGVPSVLVDVTIETTPAISG
jgi:hypothetical protein